MIGSEMYKVNRPSVLAFLLSAEKCNQEKQAAISSNYA